MVCFDHGIHHPRRTGTRADLLHGVVYLVRVACEIEYGQHAVIESQNRQVAILSRHQAMQQNARFLNLRQQRLHIGIGLDDQHY